MPLLKCQVNGMRLREACETLSLATETGHSKFLSIVEQRLASEEYSVSEVMYGLGQSTFKNMRRKNEWQKPIPQILAEIIFGHSGIDVTVDQSLQTFLSLGFEIQLTLDVERHNEEINGSVTVDCQWQLKFPHFGQSKIPQFTGVRLSAVFSDLRLHS